jgi:hypothetical protein
MPTILRVDAYRFFFYANDVREPPHVHIQRNEKVAKFWLDPLDWTEVVASVALS